MAEDASRIVFGLVTQGRVELDDALPKLLQWMSARAEVTLAAETAPSYARLAERVNVEEVDVAWLPPLVFVRLERDHRVVPLVTLQRAGRSTYEAVLVVRADSKVTSLEDLRGTKAAWVDPMSAAGYVLPRGQLHAQGLDPSGFFSEEQFCGSHRAALDAVREGRADVAGTHGAAGEGGALVQAETHPALRVLATFGGIPADVIAARKSLDAAVRTRLAEALVSATSDDAMRPLARAVFGVEAFFLGSEAAYAGWHRSLPAGLASGLLVAIDGDG